MRTLPCTRVPAAPPEGLVLAGAAVPEEADELEAGADVVDPEVEAALLW